MTSVPHSGAKSVTPGGSVAGHTPGPWIEIETESSVDHEWADGGRIGGWQDIGPDEGEAVAVVLFRNGSDHFNADLRGEANARLIAAAPDLLEALQYAVNTIEAMRPTFSQVKDEGHAYHDQVLTTARAAIAKATAGETRNAEPIHRRDGDEG